MTDRQPRRLSDRQRLAWLRLIRSDNVGPSSFRQLISRFGSADAALDALPGLTRRGGATKPLKIASVSEAERELELAERLGVRFIAVGESDYPVLLQQVDNPPPLIAVKGSPAIFQRPGVAIVGGRAATANGMRFTRSLAYDLGSAGLTIVSGLARGIDTAAHGGSIKTGTIAVFAGGLDRPYPPQNVALADDIVAQGGALVSEMPLGWSPRAIDFPRRNRLIAGLAYGLIVVEAAQRSGSLISARLAGEQGRLVFAVPGSPIDKQSAGSNGLLKDGATMVTEADDVLRAITPLIDQPMPPISTPPRRNTPPPAATDEDPALFESERDGLQDDDQSRVLESLSSVPTDIDEIVRHTQLSTAQVQLVLLELQLAGRIERHSGNAVSLLEAGV
ncbi:DNA-processing protein DprA [Tianweitania sp. BSSL-BM11]|uniref:DNA-processing protein DprA n=1 Tax=Tianweitania aestuarii TaxID=2814886 RepID=A0ABS5RTW7_9HYPH|nr:DNA-processing protein DprA [Tianweitania aestuarii]MBS9720490.1 DNA-processing protein DprA [Tianweitania aestuarii]